MKLSDKIIQLRKSNGYSQENLAEKLNVSRQAISRWESATAQPDAANILQLSKLFGVTTDYLLNDEYESNDDLLKVKEIKSDKFHLIMLCMITLEVMALILQFVTTIILQNTFLGVLCFLPFVALIGGFEYLFHKKKGEANENSMALRKNFYKISVWLGAYFPIRFIVKKMSAFYPRPYYSIALECVIIVLYLIVSALICLQIEKSSKK